MAYAIDTEGARGVGTTLRTSCAELRECATAFAHAGGLLRRGVALDHPALRSAVEDFLATHQAALVAIASGCGGLGRNLTWAAQSAHEVEMATAADFGLGGAAVGPDAGGSRHP